VSDTSADRGTPEHRGNGHLRVYDVLDGRRACNGRTFAVIDDGLPDGFRLDVHGNVFTSCTGGIRVYAPDGTLLGLIPVPERTSNCCWGGPASDRLYITASTSLYTVTTRTTGHGRLA
jgi:gluconolactonase